MPYRALHRPTYELVKLLSQHQRERDHGERMDFQKGAGSRTPPPCRLSLQQEPLSKSGQVLLSDVKTFSQTVNQLCILTLKCLFSSIFVRLTFAKVSDRASNCGIFDSVSFILPNKWRLW